MGKLRKALKKAGKASYTMFENLGKGMAEKPQPTRKGKGKKRTKKQQSYMDWIEKELSS